MRGRGIERGAQGHRGCDTDESGAGCPVCRDDGEVGEVLRGSDALGTIHVLTEGGVREAAADLVEAVRPGDRVLVHLGFVQAVLGPHTRQDAPPSPEET